MKSSGAVEYGSFRSKPTSVKPPLRAMPLSVQVSVVADSAQRLSTLARLPITNTCGLVWVRGSAIVSVTPVAFLLPALVTRAT